MFYGINDNGINDTFYEIMGYSPNSIVSKLDYEMTKDSEEDEEVVYEIEMDEDMEEGWSEEDETYSMDESFMSKPVIGKGAKTGKPNFKFGKTTKGFKEDMPKANPTKGTGKAKFEYKESKTKMEKPSKKHADISDAVKKEVMAFSTPKKVETKEAGRTLQMGRSFRKGGLPKPRAHSSFNANISEEVETLRAKNEEYRKALNIFRTKLNEVAVFNSNLAYATRLFTEHSTSKQEKINILKRFDNVESLKESKNLYKQIKDELSNESSKPVNESIERIVENTQASGSAVNLIESKTYENPQFLRMKDLMKKIK